MTAAAKDLDDDLEGDGAALLAALMEVDRHVGAAGWDQPARLFALVRTTELAAAEPALAASLGLDAAHRELAEDHLTAVEQDDFAPGEDLLEDLAALAWPPEVHGCAVSTVRSFLPAGTEAEIPDDDPASYVAQHPQRRDVRVVVGVDRAGHRHGLARVATHADELLSGRDLVPGLLSALAHTLK